MLVMMTLLQGFQAHYLTYIHVHKGLLSFKLFSWLLPITVNADSRGEVSAISPTPILPTTYQKSNFAYSAKNWFFDTKTSSQCKQMKLSFYNRREGVLFPLCSSPEYLYLGFKSPIVKILHLFAR